MKLLKSGKSYSILAVIFFLATTSCVQRGEGTAGETANTLRPAQKPSPLEESVPPPSTTPHAIYGEARQFHVSTLPMPERKKKMLAMARVGDEKSIQVLMELGDYQNDTSGLNRMALEALGTVKRTAIYATAADYLKQKIDDPNTMISTQAIKSYGRLLGDGAISDYRRRLMRLRGGSEMHGKPVRFERAAIVQAFGQMRSARAMHLLKLELLWVGRNADKKLVKYGTTLIDVLAQAGGVAAEDAILKYARKLRAKRPRDSVLKELFNQKAMEAEQVVSSMTVKMSK